MNDYDLGLDLRRQILMDLELGRACDGRRLQALAGDYCAEQHAALLPAVRHLMLSPGFSEAVNHRPPLPADGRLQLRLQQELEQVFAPAICERMQAVLQGLLRLPSINMMMETTPQPQPASATTAATTAAVAAASPESPRSHGGLVALLGFIAGVLVVGVGGGLAWLWLQSEPPGGNPTLSRDPVVPQDASPAPPDPVTEAPPAAPDLSGADLNRAIASVQQVYNDLSLGNMQGARQLFSGTAADQFDPAFFRQFQRVSVDNLQETGREGSTITLQGVVTFVYPDGSSQSESRSFTVDTATDPALITASSFGQVLQGRR